MSTIVEIILLKDIKGLGKFGQTKQVRLGYARNYLFPNALAMTPSADNIARLVSLTKKEEKKVAQEKATAEALFSQINEKAITLTVTTHDNGKLYGSVSSQDIMEELKKAHDITIEKHKIALETPIKEVGTYTVEIHLHPEIQAKISLEVTPAKAKSASKTK